MRTVSPASMRARILLLNLRTASVRCAGTGAGSMTSVPVEEELLDLLGLDEDALVPGVAGGDAGTCGVGVLGHGFHT